MSFRRSYKVLVESAGVYTNGTWVPGTRSIASCIASVQPLNIKDEGMLPAPEGRHNMDSVKVYTADTLNVTADGDGVQPDIVVFDGYGYELNRRDAHLSGVINHNRYMGTKVFKFTNDTAWLNGTLARP
jgi:hypothetical protein